MVAITPMPLLTNKKQVHSFSCMINYLAKFSLRLSELAGSIRELSKDMKKEIASALFSLITTPRKNYSADRWQHQRCWCLSITDSKPVYFANETLTNAQKSYVVIELESLAVA